MTLKFDGWAREIIGHLFYTTSSFVHHFKSINEFKLKHSPEIPNSGQIGIFFVPCDFEIWWMTLENNRAPLLYYIKLCASLLQSGNAQIGSKSAIFCPVRPWKLTDDPEQGKSEGIDSCDQPSNLTQIGFKLSIFTWVTLKFDGWPPKMIRHVFYTTSSFVYHFISISAFKLELQSGNTQSGSN